MPGEAELDVPALEALADAARRVATLVRVTRAPREVLGAARAALERAAELLAPHAHPGPYAQAGLDVQRPPSLASDALRRPAEVFPYSPVLGPRNPIAPPVVCEVEGGAVRAVTSFGPCYAGAPGAPAGLVHGGVIALVMDELLGYANVVNQTGAMTGTLTIRYRSPTPLGRAVRMEARTERVEGRKVFARGAFWHGERLTAEAEGVFIRVERVPDA